MLIGILMRGRLLNVRVSSGVVAARAMEISAPLTATQIIKADNFPFLAVIPVSPMAFARCHKSDVAMAALHVTVA